MIYCPIKFRTPSIKRRECVYEATVNSTRGKRDELWEKEENMTNIEVFG